MNTCDSEIVKDSNEPYFHSSTRKPNSITQSDIDNLRIICNRDGDIIQGIRDPALCKGDDKESNNNMFLSEELDMLNDELDSDQKDYECAISMSDCDSPSTSTDHVVDCNNLSKVFQGDWPMDRMYWNEDSDVMIASSMEGDRHPDTASMMSFDSSMASSVLNQMSVGSDRLHAKADVVYTLLSMLHTHDKMEVSEMLLTMSNSRENCVAMIESGCLPLLVQLLHDRTEKQTFMAYRQSTELRKRSSQILHNIVFSQPDDKKGRREARVLRLLEQVREFSDFLRISQYEINDNDKAQYSDQQLVPTVAALMKLSFDEEHRHAMCLLGGLQAIAELVEIDQEVHGCASDQYCITIRRYSGMALTNLTFGDGTNKTLLCSMRPFMHALVAQLHSSSEELRQVTASVLRNLSWRADPESKKILREVGAVTTLMKVAMEATKESSLKSILSALWNLSVHCSENKADICAIDEALGFLVGTLTYKSGCKNLAVVENGGGILRNISSHIALQNDHRITLRKHNCLQILLHHLKSPSLTVVSNACGTLWNLSARNAQDQRTLWEMGAVGMLKKLINSKHKMISMGSSAALKNLLAAMPPGLDPSMGLSFSDCNSSMVSLHVRKQAMLYAEIDQNLSETCDNTDSPKSSPTYKKKSAPRRTQSAPACRQGIPTRVGNKPQTGPEVNNGEKFPFEVQNTQRQESPTPVHDQNERSRMMGKTNFAAVAANSLKINNVRSSHEPRSPCGMSQKDHRQRVASPVGLRPPSYPSQRVKPNAKQPTPSQPLYNRDIPNDYHEHENVQTGMEEDVTDDHFPKFNEIRNTKYEELESQELPVDYSLKYSDENSLFSKSTSKNSSESKIPLPKMNNYTDQSCRPSAIVSPMFVKHTPSKQRAIQKITPPKNQCMTNSSFKEYTETDLDDMDQVVDYSQRYHERQSLDECRLRERAFRSNSLPQQRQKNGPVSKLVNNCEDTVKVYCTEDTPVNFSSASSFTDLCDIDSLASEPKAHRYEISPSPSRTTKKEVEYVRTPDKIAAGDKEGKVNKNDEEAAYAETPLMFSRCSSLSSLSSFDQPSIPDDHSSISDFSRMASGIVSPSDLPDSPSQTMPASPNRKQQNAFTFEKKDNSTRHMPKNQLTNNAAPLHNNGVFDEVRKTYAVEGSPCAFSSASSFSSLTIESGDDPVRASVLKKPLGSSPRLINEKTNGSALSGTQKTITELQNHSNEKGSTNVPLRDPRSQSKEKWNETPKVNVICNVGSARNNPQGPTKAYGFAEDTIKVYNTEGTPNLSHAASYSDLSMLSFCAEKYTCEPSLEGSYAESYASGEDDADAAAELHLKWQEKRDKEKSISAFNDWQEHSNNCSVDDENELLLQCIEAGMPKPPVPLSKEQDEQRHIRSQDVMNLKNLSAKTESRNISQSESTNLFQLDKSSSSMKASSQSKNLSSNIAIDSPRNEAKDLKNTRLDQSNKFGTKNNEMEETRLPNSHLVEGTPISFSCNSSLSSLSIESGDEPDCNVWKLDSFALSGMNKQSKYGAESEIPQQNYWVQNNTSNIDTVKGACFNNTEDQNCLNMETNTLEKIGSDRTKVLRYEFNRDISKSNCANFTMVQESTKAMPKNIPKQNNINQATKTSDLRNADGFSLPNQNSNRSYFQKSTELDSRSTPSAGNSVLLHNKNENSLSQNKHQATSVEANTETPVETTLSDYEEALLQKCILAGMPKPKQTGSTIKTPKDTEVDSKSSNTKPPHSDSDPKDVTHKTTISEYEEEMLQKCIIAGMPKPKSVESGTRQKKITINDWSKDVPPETTVETTLSDYEETLLQKCILAGMPKPKQTGSTMKAPKDTEVDSKSINMKPPHFDSDPKDVTHKTAISEYEEEMLQKCILAGMPKRKSVESSTRQEKNTINDWSKDVPPETTVETTLSDYEEALLQKCILAGMPKPKQTGSTMKTPKDTEVDSKSINMKALHFNSDHKDVTHKTTISEYEEDMLQKCILAGMPKPKAVESGTRQEKITINDWSKDVPPVEHNDRRRISNSKLSDHEDGLLQPCISSGMPNAGASYTKMCNTAQSNERHNCLPTNCKEAELCDYEEALLQQCITTGMPKPKATGATMKSSNILHMNNQRKSVQFTRNSPTKNAVRNTALPSNEEPQLQKSVSKPLQADAVQNQLIKSDLCNVLYSTQQGSDKTINKELFDGTRKKSEPRNIRSVDMSAAKNLGATQKQQNIEHKINVSQEEYADSDQLLLQKCILAGMPKQKGASSRPTVNTHFDSRSDKLSSKMLFDHHAIKCEAGQTPENSIVSNCVQKGKLPKNFDTTQDSKSSDTSFDHNQKIIQDNAGKASGLSQQNSKERNVSCTKSVTEQIHSCNLQRESQREEKVLSLEDEDALLQQVILSGMLKAEKVLLHKSTPHIDAKKGTKELPNISVQEINVSNDGSSTEHDLALEAQKITNDMLEALVDGGDDMTVSTLSCMSEIENVTPPSLMGEMGCFSLSNSLCGKDLKQVKLKRGSAQQKETLLKELQLSRLGSDSDLPGKKNKLSASTLSLSNSTDVLENINPPSGLDISLTASIGSLDSFHSDILDSKSEDRIQPDITDDNSMNERFCKAAAMVEMYTKEFSNITGGEITNRDNFSISEGLNVNIDAFEDNTEPACDTIASDIEFVDDLPCDEEDLGSETLLAPQLSSLNKDELGEGSTENLTFTLTEEPPILNETEEGLDCIISDDDLRENADLILSSLKKVHISESSDFGGLMSNGMLEDETLSLVSNESDEDCLSPGGVFSDGHSIDKDIEDSSKSKKSISPLIQKSIRSIARVLPSRKLSKDPKKFFVKSQTVSDMNVEIMSPNTDSDHSVISEHSTASLATVKCKKPSEGFINMGTFTRKKATNSNIPNISSQHCSDVTMGMNSLKSQAFSSKDSIESCSTSNSVSSLSSCGDAASVKSSGKKKTPASRISAIWKNSNKSRSKSSIESGKVKNEKAVKVNCNYPKESLSDQELSSSAALKKSRSQSSSPLTLSRSSTDEKISTRQDSNSSLRRPITLMLFKRNNSPKLNARPTVLSPAQSDKGVNLVTAATQGNKSSLPVRKSMIPMSSKVGDRTKPEKSSSSEQSDGCGKQKPCVVTMV